VANERLELPQGTLDLLILKTLALEPPARVGHFGAPPADFRRCVAGAAGFLVPGPAPARAPRMDQSPMGYDREQPESEILRVDSAGK